MPDIQAYVAGILSTLGEFMNASRLKFLAACLGACLGGCLSACTDDDSPTGPTGAKTDTVTITRKDTLRIFDTTEASVKGAAFEVRFYPVFGSKPLVLGDKYVNAGGDTAAFTLARFYASEFIFVDTLGASHASPGLDLVNFADSAAEANGYYAFHTKSVPGTYAGIKFSVGVPYGLNHKDAAELALPLGPNSEMFWSWNSGYIFNRVEGKLDSAGKPISFFYHVGTDNRKQTVSLYALPDPMMAMMGMPVMTSKLEVKADGSGIYSITVDYASIFTVGLDGSGPIHAVADTTERSAHGGPLADRIFLNMQTMFKKKA
jgi:methanobactin biosynthesis MbnP-like protein